MNKKLREALSGQVLARYDPDLNVIITWNGSATFNVCDSKGGFIETFAKYKANTNAGPCTPAEALAAINEHVKEMLAAESIGY